MLSKRSIRDELTMICKNLHMKEQCSIRGLLTPDKSIGARKTEAKKKIRLKMRHIFLLNSLVINCWRS